MNKLSHSRCMLAALAIALSMPVIPLRAAIVSSADMAAQSQAQADRAKVQSFVDRADVRERMQALGVQGVVAKDRVAALNEQEVHALAQRIDAMPAGGAFSTTEIIIILLVVILVAVLI